MTATEVPTNNLPDSGDVVILKALVGSQAYGFANKDSDEDFLGIFVAPTYQFHGLNPPVTMSASVVTKDPDCTLHEALKFARLALNSNPTCNELLWLPDDCYVVTSSVGEELIDIRRSFLSKERVRNAYIGYAMQQFRDLERRGGTFGPDLKKRTAKHARHLLRLCDQGVQLWTEGRVDVRVKDPQRYIDFGNMVAKSNNPLLALERVWEELEAADTLMYRVNTWLPDEPDFARAEMWLRHVRRVYDDGRM